ncbi:MAG: YceI family protein [Caldilineaceae bacterium]
MLRTLGKLLFLLSFLGLLAACAGAAPTASITQAPPTATTAPAAKQSSGSTNGVRTFVIVPEQSKAVYLVDEEFFAGALAKLGINAGKTKVTGSTQAIAGQLQLNLANLASALGDNSFTVQMNTLVTNQDRRDKWIRENGPTFNSHPEATFKATAIQDAPTAYTDGAEVSFKLAGDLTIREQTKPATFAVKAKLAGDTLTGVATTRLKMSDFGIDPPNFANTLTVADEFGIEVQFTAKEQGK